MALERNLIFLFSPPKFFDDPSTIVGPSLVLTTGADFVEQGPLDY